MFLSLSTSELIWIHNGKFRLYCGPPLLLMLILLETVVGNLCFWWAAWRQINSSASEVNSVWNFVSSSVWHCLNQVESRISMENSDRCISDYNACWEGKTSSWPGMHIFPFWFLITSLWRIALPISKMNTPDRINLKEITFQPFWYQ